MNAKLRLPMLFMLFFGFSQLSTLFTFESSGDVLALDGIDDYAILPFEEHGVLIPKGSREYTVEVWVYPEEQAKQGNTQVILSQQVGFESWPFQQTWFKFEKGEDNAYVVLFAYLQDAGAGAHGSVSFDVTLRKNEWNYLALILKDGEVGAACNQMIRKRGVGFGDMVLDDMNQLARPGDFVIGGYHKELEEWGGLQLPRKVTYFQGYIDAIMISDVARYDLPEDEEEHPFKPPHRLEADKDTLALWNFDDEERAILFSDASRKKHTLIGKNGAHVHGWLSVNPVSSIAKTWGEIKAR